MNNTAYAKNISIDVNKAINNPDLQTPSGDNRINYSGKGKEVINLGSVEASPEIGVIRGGRGRSPQQPKQKFATLQAERRSYEMINRQAHAYGNEAALFDSEKKESLANAFVSSRPIHDIAADTRPSVDEVMGGVKVYPGQVRKNATSTKGYHIVSNLTNEQEAAQMSYDGKTLEKDVVKRTAN